MRISFYDIGFDAIYGFLKDFFGFGKRNPQVAFTHFPESGAWRKCYMGFSQDFHRKIIGRFAECFDVREGIKGAFRAQTFEARDLVQSVDDDMAATVILFQKILKIILRSGDCSDCGFLDEWRYAESDTFPELGHEIDGFMIAYDVADPPTRHRIGFG